LRPTTKTTAVSGVRWHFRIKRKVKSLKTPPTPRLQKAKQNNQDQQAGPRDTVVPPVLIVQ